MSAIIIKADKESNKILIQLAKKLGASGTSVNDDPYEDFLLGSIMDSEKTGETVSKEDIFKKLK